MAALATVLSRIGGIDKDDRPASVCSFALESLLEVSPTCVQDAFGQVPLHHAIDRQSLKGDRAESGDQRASQLVQKVLSLISHVFRESSQCRDGFTAVRSSQLSPRHATLQDTELALGRAIPSRVFDVLAVGEGVTKARRCCCKSMRKAISIAPSTLASRSTRDGSRRNARTAC